MTWMYLNAGGVFKKVTYRLTNERRNGGGDGDVWRNGMTVPPSVDHRGFLA